MPDEETPPGTQAVDPEHFRGVAGHLASGVCVITTAGDGTHYGMTASSVTSLSLEPPQMLVCLNSSMPTAQAVARAGRYAINVMDRQSAELARRFATRLQNKFAGVEHGFGVVGVPLLAQALATIECEVVEQIVGGTHTIFIGRVVAAGVRDGEPLTYFRGGFGRFELERDESVYLQLRQELTRRHWKASTALNVEPVAAEFDLARSSVLYAMTRLSTEGLLRREPERGYVVVPFDITTSDQAFDARSAIELGAIQLAQLPPTEADLAELDRRLERMARFIVDDQFIDFDGYLDANYAFHSALVALAGSHALAAAFEQIGLRAIMAASFGATSGSSQSFLDVQRRILDGLRDGDLAAAQGAILDYTALAKQRTREILESIGRTP